MASSSTSAVVTALVGNSVVAVLKLGAFFLTGSGAMLSEAFHTIADVFNQGLLYLGIRRSERPADSVFAYGYGGERYFFALMSAVGIFLLGCGVTLYHGIHSLLHPPELEFSIWVFVVLGISFVIDAWVFMKALDAVKEQMGDRDVSSFLKSITDPTALAVLLEDLAACIGVLIALVAILLSQWTENPVWDSIGSIVIGLMMGLIAVWLGYQNRVLVLGRRIPEEVRNNSIEYLLSQPSVKKVSAVQSRVIGSGDFKLKAEVDFDGEYMAESLSPWVLEQAPGLQEKAACQAFTAEFGERMMGLLAAEVDRLERELRKRHPELKHLDLEAD